MRNDQDIANLILYIQTEIQLFQTTGEPKHLENCLSELQVAHFQAGFIGIVGEVSWYLKNL
jgi:hypothetical protein